MWQEFNMLRLYKAKLNLMYCFRQKNILIFLTIMQANLDFGKIQTFYTKYRPNKDLYCSKGLTPVLR